MHKPESILENETYKILLNLEMQMDLQIPTRRPDLGLTNKKKQKRNELSWEFCRPSKPRSENKKQRKR